MERNACVATLALVALLALACGGADAPAPPLAPAATATPVATPTVVATSIPMSTPVQTATATPTPTASPTSASSPTSTVTPTPTATPTVPAPLAELVEPAPGAFEHRTFEPGEEIDWPHGIFFMDMQTERIEGYRVVADIGYEDSLWGNYHTTDDNNWISGTDGYTLWLLDRSNHRAWKLAEGLRTVSMSRNRMLLSDRGPSGLYWVLEYPALDQKEGSGGAAVFSIKEQEYQTNTAFFSPQEDILVLMNDRIVYLVELNSMDTIVLFDGKTDATHTYGVELDLLGKIGFLVSLYGKSELERHAFDWSGKELPWNHHWVSLSPDGRYALRAEEAREVWSRGGTCLAWPLIGIEDVATGLPLFRVRSAESSFHDWLADGSGIVAKVGDDSGELFGFAIVRIQPQPRVAPLPLPPEGRWTLQVAPSSDAGRYFVYAGLSSVQVYDAADGRWGLPVVSEHASVWFGIPFWGVDHREMRFRLGPPLLGERGCLSLIMIPPKLEFPPYDDTLAFRVAGTASCLYLRAEPGGDRAIRDCLPDGTRLLFSELPEWVEANPDPDVRYRDPFVAWWERPWVHVRTDDGAEGWVALEYLEWH